MHPTLNTERVQVTVHELTKRFGQQLVLDRICFEVQPGELFVIMGPSGAGKSVLLRHLAGLERPDHGTILINGQPVDHPDVRRRYRIAMVFQTGALLNSLTVFENVALYLKEHRLYPPELIEKLVREKLQLLGLEDAAEKLPAQLSGGMRKRVAIARALIMEPHLILYDEPTSELDPVNASMIGREIWRLNREHEVTTIVVTHDRELGFRIADRIAIMINGRIAAIGTPEEIRDCSDPEVRNFLDAQIVTEQQAIKEVP